MRVIAAGVDRDGKRVLRRVVRVAAEVEEQAKWLCWVVVLDLRGIWHIGVES